MSDTFSFNRWRACARFVPAFLLAIGIFVLSSQPIPTPPLTFPFWDKFVHGAVYGVLALLLLFGAGFPRRWPAALMWACVAALYGVSDEWHQSYVPGRQADVLDAVADGVGALVVCSVVQLWQRRRPHNSQG